MKLCLLLILFASPVFAGGKSLIDETEELRQSLPSGDVASRRALTLKLAHMIYNEALNLSLHSEGQTDVERKIVRLRKRGVQLYLELLSARDSNYDEAQIALMQFRLARFHADLGQMQLAKELWVQLYKLEQYPDIASEAALSLGELWENDDNTVANRKNSLEAFDIAVRLGKNKDSVAYAHYRKAWVLSRDSQYGQAVLELKQALFDGKGNVKDEVLHDLINFSVADGEHLKPTIDYLASLEEKINRRDLLMLFSEGLFAAGNKEAGMQALVATNARHPKLLTQIRLLEEYYSVRNWDALYPVLDKLQAGNQKFEQTDESKNAEKILRRLLVQLDSERKTNQESLPAFLQTSDLYLDLFPDSDIAFKIAESSYSAEQKDGQKIARLNAILKNQKLKFKPAEILSMREQLVSLYQKQQNHDEALKVLDQLLASSLVPADMRRFQFVRAHELKDAGRVDDAKKQFAAIIQTKATDDFAVKSQLTLVRMLGTEKNYGEIARTSAAWLAIAKKDPKLKSNADVQTVFSLQEKSEFEWAAQKGETAEALAIFKKFCFAEKFLPQSCENTRVLAIKLSDYPSLIALYEYQDKEQELADTYELIGDFKSAANLQEKLLLKTAKASIRDHLRVALLYEIAGDLSNRNRILKKMEKYTRTFSSPEEEQVVFQTLRDAGMLTKSSALQHGWSEDRRCHLANDLWLDEPRDKNLERVVMDCKTYPGKAWSNFVVARVKALFEQQKAMGFYGKHSKQKFERRLAGIKQLNKEIEKYFATADAETKSTLASIGETAFTDFAREIINSPIEGAAPEQVQEIKNGLAQMATPFSERAEAYRKLKTEVATELAAKQPMATEAALQTKPVDQGFVAQQFQDMRSEIKRKQAMTAIKDKFEQTGNGRVASYFKGRLSQKEQGDGR